MQETLTYFPKVEDIIKASETLKGISEVTPLSRNENASAEFEANVYLKREDLQKARSYKIRGAYNKMSSLGSADLKNGVVCASAGNHAQGVAYSCKLLKVKGTIFMPAPTPQQKIDQVRMHGGDFVSLHLFGDTFDDANHLAQQFCKDNNATFIPPFEDEKVIEGQATVGYEIHQQAEMQIDYIFLPVGGGGLASGVSSYFKNVSPSTKIIGVEPQGAASMSASIQRGEHTSLETIDHFVDGAAVKRVGLLNYNICKEIMDDVITVHEGKICETILNLYNKEAIVVEPAGALALSALSLYKDKLKGKNVVCIVSGGNNDITRTEEIRERALLYQGLKHYFIVRFPQRAGALKEFVAEVLGPNDDITHFEYTKKNSRETGSAIVGIELKSKSDLEPLVERMKQRHFYGDYLNDNNMLMNLLV